MAAAPEESWMNAMRFAKLGGSNYRMWAFDVRLYLESLDLFENIDGTAEVPTDDPQSQAMR